MEQPENESRDAEKEADTYEERSEKFMNATRMYSTKKNIRRVCIFFGWKLDNMDVFMKSQSTSVLVVCR